MALIFADVIRYLCFVFSSLEVRSFSASGGLCVYIISVDHVQLFVCAYRVFRRYCTYLCCILLEEEVFFVICGNLMFFPPSFLSLADVFDYELRIGLTHFRTLSFLYFVVLR